MSDGSFKDGRGTSAFVLEDERQKGRVMGVNAVPGEFEDQSAYRSELAGVSGIIATIQCICTTHNITQGSIEVGLDGLQAMKEISGNWPIKPSQSDYDLLQDIRRKIQKSPITWKWRWVEGHQDDGKKYKDLDRWAQLNVECDGMAKEYWNSRRLVDKRPANQEFSDEHWSVWIEGKKLTKLDKHKLYEFTFGDRTRAYWHRKHSITPDLIKNINWDACDYALSKLPFGKRRWLLKHITGFCGIGTRALKRRHQDHDECPRCGEREDIPHIVKCKGNGTNEVFTLALQDLALRMTTLYTEPDIQRAIIRKVKQWRAADRNTLPRYPPDTLQDQPHEPQ